MSDGAAGEHACPPTERVFVPAGTRARCALHRAVRPLLNARPPRDLLQFVPDGTAAARVLCVGCRDPRDVLYTQWAATTAGGRRGLRAHAVTLVHESVHTLARALVLLHLAASAPRPGGGAGWREAFSDHVARAWELFFNAKIAPRSAELLARVLADLARATATRAAWAAGLLATRAGVRFADDLSRQRVHALCTGWLLALRERASRVGRLTPSDVDAKIRAFRKHANTSAGMCDTCGTGSPAVVGPECYVGDTFVRRQPFRFDTECARLWADAGMCIDVRGVCSGLRSEMPAAVNVTFFPDVADAAWAAPCVDPFRGYHNAVAFRATPPVAARAAFGTVRSVLANAVEQTALWFAAFDAAALRRTGLQLWLSCLEPALFCEAVAAPAPRPVVLPEDIAFDYRLSPLYIAAMRRLDDDDGGLPTVQEKPQQEQPPPSQETPQEATPEETETTKATTTTTTTEETTTATTTKAGKTGPLTFDYIETDELVDEVGLLPLLVSVAPLLRCVPHAVAHMCSTTLRRTHRSVADYIAGGLCHAPLCCTEVLLGVRPTFGDPGDSSDCSSSFSPEIPPAALFSDNFYCAHAGAAHLWWSPVRAPPAVRYHLPASPALQAALGQLLRGCVPEGAELFRPHRTLGTLARAVLLAAPRMTPTFGADLLAALRAPAAAPLARLAPHVAELTFLLHALGLVRAPALLAAGVARVVVPYPADAPSRRAAAALRAPGVPVATVTGPDWREHALTATVSVSCSGTTGVAAQTPCHCVFYAPAALVPPATRARTLLAVRHYTPFEPVCPPAQAMLVAAAPAAAVTRCARFRTYLHARHFPATPPVVLAPTALVLDTAVWDAANGSRLVFALATGGSCSSSDEKGDGSATVALAPERLRVECHGACTLVVALRDAASRAAAVRVTLPHAVARERVAVAAHADGRRCVVHAPRAAPVPFCDAPARCLWPDAPLLAYTVRPSPEHRAWLRTVADLVLADAEHAAATRDPPAPFAAFKYTLCHLLRLWANDSRPHATSSPSSSSSSSSSSTPETAGTTTTVGNNGEEEDEEDTLVMLKCADATEAPLVLWVDRVVYSPAADALSVDVYHGTFRLAHDVNLVAFSGTQLAVTPAVRALWDAYLAWCAHPRHAPGTLPARFPRGNRQLDLASFRRATLQLPFPADPDAAFGAVERAQGRGNWYLAELEDRVAALLDGPLHRAVLDYLATRPDLAADGPERASVARLWRSITMHQVLRRLEPARGAVDPAHLFLTVPRFSLEDCLRTAQRASCAPTATAPTTDPALDTPGNPAQAPAPAPTSASSSTTASTTASSSPCSSSSPTSSSASSSGSSSPTSSSVSSPTASTCSPAGSVSSSFTCTPVSSPSSACCSDPESALPGAHHGTHPAFSSDDVAAALYRRGIGDDDDDDDYDDEDDEDDDYDDDVFFDRDDSRRPREPPRGTWAPLPPPPLPPPPLPPRCAAAAAPPVHACAHCGKTTGLQRCSRCRATYYCSVACQHADWPRHKTVCRRPAAGTNTK